MARIPAEEVKEEGVIATPTSTTDEEAAEEKPIEYAPQGTICDAHNLYQTKPDSSGCTTWSKEIPNDLPIPPENPESAQFALIVRKVKCYTGRKNLSIHSIVVQSDPLKKFLGKVLDKYPGVTTTLERVEFKPPFKPLVHRWEDFLRLRDEEQDATTKKVVDLFYHILEEELRDDLARKADLISNGVITHMLLWSIFEPDDVVIASEGGRRRAYICTGGSGDNENGNYTVNTKYVDFDGDDFGYQTRDFEVPHFPGTSSITSLTVSPLRYHPDKAEIREKLVARGKSWEEHKGYHYKEYEGIANGNFNNNDVRYHVKSRIIIDAEAYNIFHPTETVSIDDRIDGDLNDTQRLVATPMLHGYSLKDKEWMSFYLDLTKEIVWDSQAFESLVLPQDQKNLKQLILAIAKAQSKHLDTFDDVVQGKGRGIVMQLSGPPGVGKTLTAESVAEVMKVPLYVMSAGDLGSDADGVERSLKNILRMIPKWGAVLLLDEADVFMEARSATDLARNELVSIFLRMLEYYEGILFLTTNRAENIDPAFESRIHLSLVYQDLDTTSRRHIWTQFLGRSLSMGAFSEEQIDQMAEVQLNGRQIKNVIKTANLLAWAQETELKHAHVQTVLDLKTSNAPAPGSA